jgi:hypothetical protein
MQITWRGLLLLILMGSAVAFAATKYNPQFGTAWQLALKEKAPRRWLDCVIRVQTPPTPDEVAQLKATGFQPRSIIHDIITGRIQACHVAKFLKLPFVMSVEGGGMGGPKQTRGLK